MERIIRLNVNEEIREVIVRPRQSLLDVLRNELNLTGTKKGCNEGDCGACTVIMNGRTVNACLVLAVEAEGQKIITIEGLAQGPDLHPLQQAFIQYGGFQCGFCTPGMLLTAYELIATGKPASRTQIREQLSGNLCRCTGYQAIVDAVEQVLKKNAPL
jgi:aerobic carbon-monoxide dehydrogenase small subunit